MAYRRSNANASLCLRADEIAEGKHGWRYWDSELALRSHESGKTRRGGNRRPSTQKIHLSRGENIDLIVRSFLLAVDPGIHTKFQVEQGDRPKNARTLSQSERLMTFQYPSRPVDGE